MTKVYEEERVSFHDLLARIDASSNEVWALWQACHEGRLTASWTWWHDESERHNNQCCGCVIGQLAAARDLPVWYAFMGGKLPPHNVHRVLGLGAPMSEPVEQFLVYMQVKLEQTPATNPGVALIVRWCEEWLI